MLIILCVTCYLSMGWVLLVKLNGTTVSFDGNIYSHRVDIENRLSYPDTVKKGHLSMMGFDEELEAFDGLNKVICHEYALKKHARNLPTP